MEKAKNIVRRPPSNNQADEEQIDTLIAVSVVAKRLAERLRREKTENENASRCATCAYAEGIRKWRNM